MALQFCRHAAGAVMRVACALCTCVCFHCLGSDCVSVCVFYQHCRFGRVQVYKNRILQFLIHLCKGVMELHSAKKMHCDLKPENVLHYYGAAKWEEAQAMVSYTIHAWKHCMQPGRAQCTRSCISFLTAPRKRMRCESVRLCVCMCVCRWVTMATCLTTGLTHRVATLVARPSTPHLRSTGKSRSTPCYLSCRCRPCSKLVAFT